MFVVQPLMNVASPRRTCLLGSINRVLSRRNLARVKQCCAARQEPPIHRVVGNNVTMLTGVLPTEGMGFHGSWLLAGALCRLGDELDRWIRDGESGASASRPRAVVDSILFVSKALEVTATSVSS